MLDLRRELYRYLRHLLHGPDAADDLLQETFLQMHRSRAAYNPAYLVKPWVFGLARNVFLMNRRANRRWAAVHEIREELPDFPVSPRNRAGSVRQRKSAVAWSSLQANQAETPLLHHQWGFTFEEIAGMLGDQLCRGARPSQPWRIADFVAPWSPDREFVYDRRFPKTLRSIGYGGSV